MYTGCTSTWLGFDTVGSTVLAAEINLSLAALHPDSINKLMVAVDGQTVVEEWTATPGSTELQKIPGLEGRDGSELEITGVMEEGEYFAILEVRGFNTCSPPVSIQNETSFVNSSWGTSVQSNTLGVS